MPEGGMFDPIPGGPRNGPPPAQDDGASIIMPVPSNAGMPLTRHHQHGEPSLITPFRNAEGRIDGYKLRWDYPGGKTFSALTYWRDKGGREHWRRKDWPIPRPLYGRDNVAQKPSAIVLVVEGEKKAHAAERLFPDIAVISSPNGAGAAGSADWSPLVGRRIVVWPDNDTPGFGFADDAAQRALKAGAASAGIVNLPPGLDDGWDLADDLPPDLTVGRLRELIDEARPVRTDTRPAVIRLRAGELHEIATEAEAALIQGGADLYARGSKIVRPVVEELDTADGHKTKVSRLVEVSTDGLVDYFSQTAVWEKFDGRKEAWRVVDPPDKVASILLAREGKWRLPPIAGVITIPTLRPDGSILDKPGYDPITRLLLLDPPRIPAIPAKPTKDQAAKALAYLSRPLEHFPFVDQASKAVAIAGMITPVVRGAMPVAPMFVMKATTAGTGKSKLVDLSAAMAIGQQCPTLTAGRDEAETEKRLSSAVLAGQPLISIDNLNGELYGDFLCQLVERTTPQIRPLGSSKMMTVEGRACVYATGNNITVVADMVRRSLLCSLDAGVERPEDRVFPFDPVEMVLANRGKFIAAALVIVRAYIVAGYPDKLRPMASFGRWSDLVRSSLVWLGCADPLETQNAARADDPETSALRQLVSTWRDAVGIGMSLSATELVNVAEEKQPVGGGEYYETTKMEFKHPHFREALMSIAGDRGSISAVKFGTWLGRRKDRIIDGVKITAVDDTHTKIKRWRLSR